MIRVVVVVGKIITANINLRSFGHLSASTKTHNTTTSPINHHHKIETMPSPVEAKIAPSMLSSDFANLASEAQRMLTFGADWLHMDIMVPVNSISSLLQLLKI